MQAYCMKSREKVEIKNPKAITMKNGCQERERSKKEYSSKRTLESSNGSWY